MFKQAKTTILAISVVIFFAVIGYAATYTGTYPKDLDLTTPTEGNSPPAEMNDADREMKKVLQYQYIVNSTSVNRTLGANDSVVLVYATGGTRTIALPSVSTVSSATVHKSYTIKKMDSSANTVIVDANGSQTIDGALTYTLYNQFDAVSLIANGTSWSVVGGSGIGDSDTVDTFHASQTAAANTVAVSKSTGDLDDEWIDNDYAPLRDEYRNLSVTNSATKTITATADYIMLWNGSNYPKRLTSFNQAAVLTNSGAAGLDTGTGASNTWYHIWAIASDAANRLLLSTNSTAPTMPSGYTFKGYVGAVYNGATSGGFRDFSQKNDLVFYRQEVSLAANTLNAWTAQSNASYIPATATQITVGLATNLATLGLAPNYNGFGGCYHLADVPATPVDYGIFSFSKVHFMTCEIPYTSSTYYYTTNAGYMFYSGWRY